MAFAISSPKDNQEVPARFAATGTTNTSKGGFEGVQGQLTIDGKEVKGRMMGIRRNGKAYWLIIVDAKAHEGKDNGELNITHNKKSTKRKVKKLKTVITATSGSLTLDWPYDTNHCGLSFIAYGTRAADESPVSAKLQHGSDPEIPADFIYEDPETSFWCAQFSAVPTNTYKLMIAGANTGAADFDINIDGTC